MAQNMREAICAMNEYAEIGMFVNVFHVDRHRNYFKFVVTSVENFLHKMSSYLAILFNQH